MKHFTPPIGINFPIYCVHELRKPFGLIGKFLDLNDLYNKNKTLYRFFARNAYWEANPRVAEIPLVLYYVGKYLVPPARILDVGYLESFLPYFLSSIGFEVFGVDIRETPFYLIGANIRTIKQDICKLTLETKFDAITLISTLEHIGLGYGDTKDLTKDKEALSKVYDLLDSQGLLFVSVPMYKEFRVIENFEKHYDYKNFIKLLESAGFKILEEKYVARKENFWVVEDLSECLKREDTFVGFFVCEKG